MEIMRKIFSKYGNYEELFSSKHGNYEEKFFQWGKDLKKMEIMRIRFSKDGNNGEIFFKRWKLWGKDLQNPGQCIFELGPSLNPFSLIIFHEMQQLWKISQL